MSSKPIMLSGIKPTGELHLGNYFGAMRQLVEIAKKGEHQCFVMVADYHALNTMQDAEEMRRRTRELVMAYLAVGLDPKEVVLFKQSDVPAHTELAWIFDTITTMPYLMRAHAFKASINRAKEAFLQGVVNNVVNRNVDENRFSKSIALQRKIDGIEDNNHELDLAFELVLSSMQKIGVGTFNYPMLMASDILLYDTAVVPVGADQKQHIEYARDTAEKFNRTFKEEVFSLPKDYIMPEVAIVAGTDGQKMSKSYGNVIPLFASKEELTKAVMSIVTDSSGGRPENVYAIHKLIRSEEELNPIYESHAGSYKMLKETLIEDLDMYFAPMRAKYEELKNDPNIVEQVLHEGKLAARAASEAKMEQVKKAIGVS